MVFVVLGVPQMTYDCQALHGDITQANRESTLAAFKKGSFKVRTNDSVKYLQSIIIEVIPLFHR